MKFLQRFLFIFLLISALGTFAQEAEFKTEVSRKSLGQNEHLRVDFSINTSGDNFSAPNFEGFSVLEKRQSVQHFNNNGKVTQHIVFTFVLQPTRQGKLTIGAASIEANNKVYKSQPVAVTVTEPVKNPQNQTANANPLRGLGSGFPFGNFPFSGFDPFEEEEETDYEIPEIPNDEIFITAEVSKQNPYVNQAVTVIYRLYVLDKYGFRQGPITAPEFRDFVIHENPIGDWKVTEQMRNGKNYRVATIKQLVLFPQKSGKITLSPVSVDFLVQVPLNKLDRFRRRLVANVNKAVLGGGQTFDIKDLPEQGKPMNFSGAVGNFSVKTEISKTELKADEVLSAKLTISGKGNFKLFELPKLNFPSTLEVYDPEQKEQLTQSISGTEGNITQTYTIIPQYKGKYPIVAVSFNYFDPIAEKYITETTQEHFFEVTQGENFTQSSDKQEVNQKSESFRFLKLNADLQPMEQKSFFGSWKFYLGWLLPLMFIPIVIFYWKWRENRQNDTQGTRIRIANRLAKKYLSTAKRNLTEKDSFYEALERGLHNYLKAKLQIETSELRKERIGELLAEKQVQTTAIEELLQLLSNCEMARYSPYTQTDMQNDYQKATEVIEKLHRK